MSKIRIVFISLTLFSYSALSQASLLVEPILGYNFSSGLSTKGKDYSSGGGMGYGGRIGLQKSAFQVGLDYLKSDISMSSNDFNRKVSEQEYGLFVGFKFPILVKVYGTYIFSATGDTEINSTNVDLSGGSGYKLGVGFTILPFVDLNLDYRKVNFDHSIDLDSMMFSASLPFNFL